MTSGTLSLLRKHPWPQLFHGTRLDSRRLNKSKAKCSRSLTTVHSIPAVYMYVLADRLLLLAKSNHIILKDICKITYNGVLRLKHNTLTQVKGPLKWQHVTEKKKFMIKVFESDDLNRIWRSGDFDEFMTTSCQYLSLANRSPGNLQFFLLRLQMLS